MKPVVRALLALAMLAAANCSSGAAKPTPGGGGDTGTAGTSAGAGGTGGSLSPDGGGAGTGGGMPDGAAGRGGAPQDAALDVPAPPGIIIQEDQPGFAAVDGKIYPRQGSTSVTGYTGSGFADGDPGAGKTIAWSVKAETAGTYQLIWRYAFGGLATNLRDATLIVNGVTAAG